MYNWKKGDPVVPIKSLQLFCPLFSLYSAYTDSNYLFPHTRILLPPRPPMIGDVGRQGKTVRYASAPPYFPTCD